MTTGADGAGSLAAPTGEATLEALVDRLMGWTPSADDLEAARARVADVAVAVRLGCVLSSSDTVERTFRRLLGPHHGSPPGTGPQVAASWEGAVLAARCRLTEIDDIELATCTTPGSVVVPAALAAVGPAGRGGRDLLDAVAFGYEVVVGAAALLGGAFAPSAGTWPTRAVAAVGAAATVARALGLPPDTLRHAVALGAGTSSVGVAPEPARAWSLGMAVAQGVGAAVAAAEGLRGDGRVLARWPGGAYAPAPPGSVEQVAGALRVGASAVRRSRLKPYAAARQVLSASATLRALVEAGDIDGAEVAGVEVTVPAVHAAMVDRRAVAVRLDTLASAQYQLATALEAPSRLDELDHLLPPAAALADRMASVTVVAGGPAAPDGIGAAAGIGAADGMGDPDVPDGPGASDGAFPGRWTARLELLLRDGRRVRHAAPGVPGEEAFGCEQVAAKARRLATANGIATTDVAHLVALVRKDDWTGLVAALATGIAGDIAGDGRPDRRTETGTAAGGGR